MLINKNLEVNNVKHVITGIEEEVGFIPNFDTEEQKNLILPVYNYTVFPNSIVISTEASYCEKYLDKKFFIYDLYNYEKINVLNISNIFIRINKNYNILNILNNSNYPKFIIIIIKDTFLDNRRILEFNNNEIIFEENIVNFSEFYLGLQYKDVWPLNFINQDAFNLNKTNNFGIKKVEGTKDYKAFRIYSNYASNTENDLKDLFVDVDLNNRFLNHNYNKIIGIDINSGKLIKNIVGKTIKRGRIKKIKLVEDYKNFIINNFNKNSIKINNNRFYDVINFRGKVKKVYILDRGNNYSENPDYLLIPSKINEKYIPPKFKFVVKDGKIENVIIKDPGDYISGDIEIKVYNNDNIDSAKIKLFIEGPILEIDPLYIDYYFDEIKKIEFEFGNGAILEPIIVNGRIEGVNIINPGRGYFNFPEIKFISDVGSGAFAVIKSINSEGGILDVEILEKGKNYNENTIITLKNKKYNNIIKNIELNSYNKIYNEIEEKYITEYTDSYSLTQHGQLVGISLDGYPIYIGVGYSNPLDSSSPLKKLTNSYTTNPTTPSDVVEKYFYTGLGDLDENNGRFCVTPEFPNGTYAYFITENEPRIPLKLKYLVESYEKYIPIFINNRIKKNIDFSYKNNLFIKDVKINDNYIGNIGESLVLDSQNNEYKLAEIEYNKIKSVSYNFIDFNKIKLNVINKVNNEYLVEFIAKDSCPVILKKDLNRLYILDGIIVEDLNLVFCNDTITTNCVNKNYILFFVNSVLQSKNLNITINNNGNEVDLIPKINLFENNYFYFYLENIDREEFILSSDTYSINITNPNLLIFVNGIIQYSFNISGGVINFSDILKQGDNICIVYLNDVVYYNLYVDPIDFYIKEITTNTFFNINDYNFIIIKNNVIQNHNLYNIEKDLNGYRLNDLNFDPNDNIKIIGVKNLKYKINDNYIKKRTKIYLRDNFCNYITSGILLFINGVFQDNYNVVDNYIEVNISSSDVFLIYYVPDGGLEFIENYTGPLFNDKLTFINGVFQDSSINVINENITNFVCSDIVRNLYLNNDFVYSSITNTPFNQPDFNFLLFVNNVIQDVEFEYDYDLNLYKLKTDITLSPEDSYILIGIKNLQKINFSSGLNYIDLNQINTIYIFKPHTIKIEKPINFKTNCNYDEELNYFVINTNKNNEGLYTLLLDNYKLNLIIVKSPVYNYGIAVDNQTVLLKNLIIPPNKKYFDINLINLKKNSISSGFCHFNILDKKIDYDFDEISHNVDLIFYNNNIYYPIRKYEQNELIPNTIPIVITGLDYIKINSNLNFGDIIKFDYKSNTYTGVILDDRFKMINIYGIKTTINFKLDKNLVTNVTKIS